MRGEEATYLLAGDAAYTLEDLEREVPDGFSADPRAALESLRRIKQFARAEEAVVLPSHDPDAATRPAADKVYRPERLMVCVGDSITRGKVGANYVAVLERRYGSRGFRFVNAGIDGEQAANTRGSTR